MLSPGMRLRVGDQLISLDRADEEVCFVSHAHSDHSRALASRGKRVIASDATIALASSSGVERAAVPGLSLLNSGHILGSTQLHALADGVSFVYTGDFKLEDGLTTRGAEARECDVLLIEGTYGSPEMVFPDRQALYGEMAGWIGRALERGCVLLGGYPIGKAQELVAFLNRFLGIAPLVHPRVEWFCRLYERFGVRLERIPIESDDAEEAKKHNFTAVFPHHLVSHSLARGMAREYGRSFFTALATGWALKWRFPVDRAFPLSDHADYSDIVEYVERASPRKVFVCHGNEELLSRELRKKGFSASPASEAGRQALF